MEAAGAAEGGVDTRVLVLLYRHLCSLSCLYFMINRKFLFESDTYFVSLYIVGIRTESRGSPGWTYIVVTNIGVVDRM